MAVPGAGAPAVLSENRVAASVSEGAVKELPMHTSEK